MAFTLATRQRIIRAAVLCLTLAATCLISAGCSDAGPATSEKKQAEQPTGPILPDDLASLGETFALTLTPVDEKSFVFAFENVTKPVTLSLRRGALIQPKDNGDGPTFVIWRPMEVVVPAGDKH